MVFSEVFWTGLYTASMAFFLAVGRMCYKSKCKKVDLCGCITITRDVEIELTDETKESQI